MDRASTTFRDCKINAADEVSEQPSLSDVISRLGKLSEEISNIDSRLREVGDRLAGAEPRENESGIAAPPSNGAVGELHALASVISWKLSQLYAHVDRIDRVI